MPPRGPPHAWRAPHLLLLQDLEDFLVSSLLGRQQALGDVSRPLDLTGSDHHLGPTQRLDRLAPHAAQPPSPSLSPAQALVLSQQASPALKDRAQAYGQQLRAQHAG